MLGVYIALGGLALTILGLIVKLTIFSTEIRVYVEEMRKDTRALRRLPTLEYRVKNIENHLGLIHPESAAEMHDAE